MDRIAVISDPHGNLTALEAVLADIDARGIERIFNLGDYVGKGPRGAEVIERCIERCEINIRGNWDDFLPGIGDHPSEALQWWRAELKEDHLPWLATLPLSYDFVMSGRRIRLFHASATSVHRRVRRTDGADVLAGMFARTDLTGPGPEPDVVGYGDLHEAFLTAVDRRTLFNAGSVGNPLDETTAVYVILEGKVGSAEPGPFGIQFVRVPYDVDGEFAEAAARGMPEVEEYAVELRDGIYRGDWKKSTR